MLAMTNIKQNLQNVTAAIDVATKAAHRDPKTVTLLAVSKTHPAELIEQAYSQGQRHFAENYLQEALKKITTLKELDIIWHYIGALQSNKTRLIAENFSWVHSLCRVKIAERLNAQRPNNLGPLNICLQININDEPTKEGVLLKDLDRVAEKINSLKHLKLRGLMAIPSPAQTPVQLKKSFNALKQAQNKLIQRGVALDTLSMGMSGDFPVAIECGSTMVRIGTAIFGPRDK